jgi:hypothetical protein
MFIVLSYIAVQSLYQEAQIIQDDDLLKEYQILFVGNSYIFSNDFPQIFANLAQSGGYDVSVAMLAEGGWTLSKHSQSIGSIERIQQESWDYVILQEQSIIPSNPKDREQNMYPAIRLLHKEIENMGADVILFMTWGRRDSLPQSAYNDFDEMQTGLETGYMNIADELNVMVSPVGIAWKNALEKNPQLVLWQKDGSHPNMNGSYLAACVFYAVIFQESPEGLAYMAGLQVDLGHFVQSVAAETVLDDLERWNIK